jgi:hypothetical protein
MQKHTDEQMLAAIRRVVAESAGDTAVRTYAARRLGSEPAWRTIAYRFGSWDAAVAAACEGFHASPGTAKAFDRYASASVSPETMWRAVADVASDLATAKTDPPPPARTVPAPVLPTSAADEAIVAGLMAQRTVTPATQRAAFVEAMGCGAKAPRSAPVHETRSRLAVIASDIHFNAECPKSWASFVEFVEWARPHLLILDGDLIDATMLGRFEKGASDPHHVAPEIDRLVAEANRLRRLCDRLVIIPGNHDLRIERAIQGEFAQALLGVKGLTFEEICRNHGMDSSIEWSYQRGNTRGVMVGQFLIRHGHREGGRFGAGKHVAANMLAKTMGQSSVCGHVHRAQMFCARNGEREAIGIVNPCLTGDHEYANGPDADWQRGFTILELDAPRYDRATPHVIVMRDGVFSFGGRTFGVRFAQEAA